MDAEAAKSDVWEQLHAVWQQPTASHTTIRCPYCQATNWIDQHFCCDQLRKTLNEILEESEQA